MHSRKTKRSMFKLMLWSSRFHRNPVYYEYILIRVTFMLVTKVGDERCWWQHKMLARWQWCWWHRCVDNIMMVTDFRYVGELILNRSSTPQTFHQHVWSPTSMLTVGDSFDKRVTIGLTCDSPTLTHQRPQIVTKLKSPTSLSPLSAWRSLHLNGDNKMIFSDTIHRQHLSTTS